MARLGDQGGSLRQLSRSRDLPLLQDPLHATQNEQSAPSGFSGANASVTGWTGDIRTVLMPCFLTMDADRFEALRTRSSPCRIFNMYFASTASILARGTPSSRAGSSVASSMMDQCSPSMRNRYSSAITSPLLRTNSSLLQGRASSYLAYRATLPLKSCISTRPNSHIARLGLFEGCVVRCQYDVAPFFPFLRRRGFFTQCPNWADPLGDLLVKSQWQGWSSPAVASWIKFEVQSRLGSRVERRIWRPPPQRSRRTSPSGIATTIAHSSARYQLIDDCLGRPAAVATPHLHQSMVSATCFSCLVTDDAVGLAVKAISLRSVAQAWICRA
ncbi:hypothetical protein FHX16_005923 [Rhizobium sp. BK661]|nr:hypothetical protein [Rhizobium sp. BK661]